MVTLTPFETSSMNLFWTSSTALAAVTFVFFRGCSTGSPWHAEVFLMRIWPQCKSRCCRKDDLDESANASDQTHWGSTHLELHELLRLGQSFGSLPEDASGVLPSKLGGVRKGVRL